MRFGDNLWRVCDALARARRDSLKRLVEKAAEKGANAVVGADFETSDMLRGTATLFSAYGTAVVIEPAKKSG